MKINNNLSPLMQSRKYLNRYFALFLVYLAKIISILGC